MMNEKVRRYALEQYVALHNNENRLLSERSIALVFASSFLAVVWAVDSPIGLEGRLAVATLGLFINIMLWRVIFRSAQAAENWRSLAIQEEKWVYGWYPGSADFSKGPDGLRMALSKGPYGLRMARDRERGRSVIERAWRLLRWPGLGHTNIWSAICIPLILTLWWGFAICYSFHVEWKQDPMPVEVRVLIENEVYRATPNDVD